MKHIFKISLLFLGIAALVFSCKKEEIDTTALTDFPPGFLSIYPGDGGKVVFGKAFDVTVKFADGTVSPLASGSVKLMNDGGTELASASKNLSGTEDSIVIAGTSFNAASLAVGKYKMAISVTDSKGKTSTRNTTFEVSTLPYAAVQGAMWLSGAFNAWGAAQMTLVGPYTWQVQVTMDGGQWKLKNTVDWTDKDWGDPDCDGLVEETTGGGANSACSPSGDVIFTYNDLTLRYTIAPAVTFKTNISGLYLLGSFNDFTGSKYKFSIVADYTWELKEIQLKPGQMFKFAEYPSFMGRNWGDNEPDGKADEFGSNIAFAAPEGEAFYKVTFNDKTRAYKFDFLRYPSIGIIGSATPGGWDTETQMTDKGGGVFEITMDFVAGEAKFRANNAWDTNWGAVDFPTGVGVQNGPNIPVPAGRYKVTFKPGTGEYNFEVDAGYTSIGIIGSATPGGWSDETKLHDNGDGTYDLIIGLADGEAKFRANNAWDVNWGAVDFPTGVGAQNGPNIPITKGLYLVTFNSKTGEYSFTPTTIGIIGDATPGSWNTDTDMTTDGTNAAIQHLNITLTAGGAKFRGNHDWKYNWGAAGFPSGVGTQDGPNIPVTAGTYNVTFNVNTGEYSFQ